MVRLHFIHIRHKNRTKRSPAIGSFIHLSPAHIYQELPEGSVDASISEYVYDIGFGDPEAFLKELLAAEEKGKLINTCRIRKIAIINILFIVRISGPD